MLPIIVSWLILIAIPAFPQPIHTNEIIVKFNLAASLQKENNNQIQILSPALAAALQSAGAYSAQLALPENFPDAEGQYVLLRFTSPARPLADLISALQNLPEIEWAKALQVLTVDGGFSSALSISAPQDIPNDSLFASQWGLQKIRATQAWQVTAGAREVLLAVIDTGIELNHPDLQPNLWINEKEDLNRNGRRDASDENGVDEDGNGFVDDLAGWDFTDAPNFPDGGDYLQRDNHPADENGHGTAVAGIIAAVANNRLGIAGLAPGCRVMVLRAGNSQGLLEEDDVASAIVYAVMNGASVINMSFGDVVVSPMLRDVIRFAHRRGVTLVASAGNSASALPHYPAGFAETISVGASTISDRLASFSNYGASLDAVAPGENIWTTKTGKTYAPFSGTSAAAPFVSALAGLLLSRAPEWNNEMIRAALQNGAVDPGERGGDHFFGAGRIDAANTVQLQRTARAEIQAPAMDAGFSALPEKEKIVIRGTALGALVTGYELAYGAGEDPDAWHVIGKTSGRQVLADSLGIWPLQNLPEGVYVLRLLVQQQTGTNVEDKTRIFIDRTPPRLEDLRFLPMIDGPRHSVLLEFETDDLCHATLFWRPANSHQDFKAIPLNYFTRQQRYIFSQNLATGELEFYFEAVNRAGLKTRADNQRRYYSITLDQPGVNRTPFAEVSFPPAQTLPAGYLWHGASDFNRDGWGELIASVYTANRAYGPLTIFEKTAEGFTPRFATNFPAIPRDVADGDGDGKLEILAGLGPRSFVLEAPAPGAFPAKITWADSNDFWAAAFADLDADGKKEILGRRGRQYVVLENADDDAFNEIATLENFTAGENLTGAPHAEIGDFDGDGNNEILLGDGDAGLYIYESTGNNQFAATWQDSLPLFDSIDFIRALDFDGDGRQDFAAGCHSDPALNFENEYDGRHWLFRLYRASGDNRFEIIWEQRFLGLQSPRDFEAGMGSGDIDSDGREELFLNLFPDGYVIDYENGQAAVVWHHQPVRSNATVVAALEQGQPPAFYFSEGEAVRAFTAPNAQTGPPAPLDFDARPLHAHAVALSWQPVAGAEAYMLQRARGDSAAGILAVTRLPGFVDREVISEQEYRYTVATIDSQASPIIGPRARTRNARPSAPPRVLSAWFLPPYHVAVQFSKVMSESIRRTDFYRIRHTADAQKMEPPQSIVTSRSGREAILAFPNSNYSAGEYQIEVTGVEDVDRVPLDTAAARAKFQIAEKKPRFYLRAAELESSQDILLRFNLPVEKNSASRIENYEIAVAPAFPIKLTFAEAAVLHDDAAAVRLRLQQGMIAPLGRNFFITAKEVRSLNGLALQPGEGDAVGFALTNPDLKQVRIYPNPFIAAEHTLLTIAGLPAQATIKILDETGRVHVMLQENDGNGGCPWDTRDRQGRLLPSGIYFCQATAGKESAWAKFLIVR